MCAVGVSLAQLYLYKSVYWGNFTNKTEWWVWWVSTNSMARQDCSHYTNLTPPPSTPTPSSSSPPLPARLPTIHIPQTQQMTSGKPYSGRIDLVLFFGPIWKKLGLTLQLSGSISRKLRGVQSSYFTYFSNSLSTSKLWKISSGRHRKVENPIFFLQTGFRRFFRVFLTQKYQQNPLTGPLTPSSGRFLSHFDQKSHLKSPKVT